MLEVLLILPLIFLLIFLVLKIRNILLSHKNRKWKRDGRCNHFEIERKDMMVIVLISLLLSPLPAKFVFSKICCFKIICYDNLP